MTVETKHVEKYITFTQRSDGTFRCYVWDEPYNGARCFRLIIPVPRALWQADGDVKAIIGDEVDETGNVI